MGLRKQIETAKQIINQKNCNYLNCEDCPRSKQNNGTFCIKGPTNDEYFQFFRDWLAKNDKQEIIGWPGNVEEMRQYIGKQCVCCDSISFECTSDSGRLEIIDEPEMPYKNDKTGSGYLYCKVLPEPSITELTLDDIAKKFDIPVDQLRIKE